MLLRFKFSTCAIHAPRNPTHSAIPLGLSSPHSFARNIPTRIVASAYRLPLALRLSLNPANRSYKLPKFSTWPVLDFISTFLCFDLCVTQKHNRERSLFYTLRKPCTYRLEPLVFPSSFMLDSPGV